MNNNNAHEAVMEGSSSMPLMYTLSQLKIACAEIDEHRKFEVRIRFVNATYYIKSRLAIDNATIIVENFALFDFKIG